MKLMMPVFLVLSLTMLGCSDSVLYKVSDYKPEIVVYPEHIDFGNLISGQESGLEEIVIVNAGDADLILTSPELFDGSNRFGIDDLGGEITLKPQETYIVDVNYLPETYEHNGAFVRIVSNDEESSEIDVTVEGSGDAPVMTVYPETFDYGYISIGCDNEERITVRNDGNLELTIDSVAQMVTLPADIILEYGSLPDPPWLLIPGQEVDFLVSYVPTDIGADESIITIAGNDPATSEVELMQHGVGNVELWHTQTHLQEEIPVLDVLWVIDDSGSMNRFQTNLSSNIGLFVGTFMATGADYHMSVITTSNWYATPIITSSDLDPAGTLAIDVMVGVHGSGLEKGISMAEQALSYSSSAGPGSTFFRDDATLVVIYVSDEPDHSEGGWASYLTFFDAIKPIGQFIPYGVIGDYPGGCTTSPYGAAQFGAGYWDMIDYYGGDWYSICATDWGVQLQNLANAMAGRKAYELDERDPIVETIEVFVNGQLTEEWEYDEITNSVIFTEGNVPEEGQTIEIDYAVWGCDGR